MIPDPGQLEGLLQLLQRYGVTDFSDGTLVLKLNPQPTFLSDKAIEDIKHASDDEKDILFDAVPDVAGAE